jgi:transposase InsO family protein
VGDAPAAGPPARSSVPRFTGDSAGRPEPQRSKLPSLPRFLVLSSQFTSPRFTEVLTGTGVRVSMDGRGRWMDNVFIERLWRSMKYECVYLNAFETGSEERAGIGGWISYYNARRPHSSLGGRTPDEAHAGIPAGIGLAA